MRLHAMALLILCLALAGCDRKKKVVNSVDVDAPAGNMPGQDSPARGVPAEGTVVCSGALKLPAGSGMLPGDLQVVSVYEEVIPNADGGFHICLPETRKPQFVFAMDPETTNPVLLGHRDLVAGEAVDLSFESTAVGLAFLNPFMMGTPAEYRREFIRNIKEHPDFPLLAAAVESGFRTDPRHLLDDEANPELYRQAAEIAIDVWQGMNPAGKALALQEGSSPVPWIMGGTGSTISFLNPNFVYYAADISTENPPSEVVTVNPVLQAWKSRLEIGTKMFQALWDKSLDPLRPDPAATKHQLENGQFKVYLTKGFLDEEFDWNSANGKATGKNIERAIVLVLELVGGISPTAEDIAEALDAEDHVKHITAIADAVREDDLWTAISQGVLAVIAIIQETPVLDKIIEKNENRTHKGKKLEVNKTFVKKVSDVFANVFKKALKVREIVNAGEHIGKKGIPFAWDLVRAEQEVQYELMHNRAQITALRRQDPGDPLSGNEVKERRTFTLPGRARMEMVWVPETGRGGFWLGTHEVTQKQWKAVMGTAPWTRTPHSEPSGTSRYLVTGDPYPAVNISRRDAHEFIGRLNDAAGDSLYRLPTEEEWEYACRAGTRTAWSFGDNEEDLKHFAWYEGNSASSVGGKPGDSATIKRVGGKFPNPWGLHDMHGNVLEWVQDKEGSMSVFRGGSLIGGPDDTNSDERLLLGPEDVPDILYITGFRLLRTAEPVARPEPEPVTRVFSLLNGAADMEFVQIEPGSFSMGSPYTETGRDRDEGPQHRVKISKRFWLGAHEVTQDQWTKVMGTTPWQENGRNRSNVRSNPSHPAVYISWDDAQEFIARLNRAEGAWWYRLPTEAEWEYACRAGKSFPPTPWSHGFDESRLDQYAWYRANARNAGEAYGHAVGTKLPNSWGLHDMHGNVWEWVQDWYYSKYYSRPIMWGASNDPQGPASGTNRVGRGGSFASEAKDLRSANRSYASPGASTAAIGARLVRGDTPGEWPQDVPLEDPVAPPDSTVTFPDESEMETFALPGGVEMEFAWIEPGTFPMGAPASEGGHGNERPVHEVEISRGFYLGAHEVTQGQWEAVMGSNPSHYEGDDRPVERVSYEDAHEFIGRLNDAEGDSLYRLPTEAEWEYACRAGSPDPWSHGADEDELGRYAWYSGNNDPSGTKPVGTKWPNRWGLHDMHGNVWEWAQDWFDPDYYGDSPRVDPPGPAAGDGRVVRGGKFSNHAAGVRSAYRGVSAPGDRNNTIGFRLLRLEEPAPAPPVEEPVPPEEPPGDTTLEGHTWLWGHTLSVNSVSFSPDGRTLASGSSDNTVRLWDIVSGTQIAVLEGHTDWVSSVSFSPDGRTLASAAGGGGTVRLWDVDSRAEVAVLEGHEDGVNSVSFSPDGRTLASGSHDGTVRLWDVVSGTQTAVLEVDGDLVFTVSFSPDGRTLAAGIDWGRCLVWDVDSRTRTAVLEMGGHENEYIYSVSFSPDGRTLAAGSDNGLVRLWDVDSDTQIAVLVEDGWDADTENVSSVSFSPDGRTLAAGGKKVRLWDVASRTQTALLGPTDTDEIFFLSVSFSPDGGALAAGGLYGLVRLWDVDSLTQIAVLKDESQSQVNSVSFSPDGRTLAVGGVGWTSGQRVGTIQLWDVDSFTRIDRVYLPVRVSSVAFSPDGRTLAVGGEKVWLWDVDSLTQIAVLEWDGWDAETDFVLSVSFSSDGRTLAAGSWDETVRLWDVDSRTQTAVLEGHTNPVSDVSFSPDGRTLASGSHDRTVRLWDVDSRTQVAVLEREDGWDADTDYVLSVSFSPDGGTLAVGSENRAVRLWDVDSRTQVAVLQGHEYGVYSVSFSPDGRTLASGSWDETVRLWDVDSHAQVAVLEREDGWDSDTDYVLSVSFSPDGRTLASGGYNGTVRLWDVAVAMR